MSLPRHLLLVLTLACGIPSSPTDADSSADATADTTSPTGDSSSTVDPASILFDEDFESTESDNVPDGWDDFVGWVVNGGQNRLSSSVHAVVDTDRTRRSSRGALHVRGGANPAQITRPLPADTDRVYVRAWVWTTIQLGASPGRNHETLIGLRAGSGTASDEVRFGEIKGVIGTNEVPSDDISPTYEQWGTGPTIAPDGWRCIEVAFLGDSAAHEVRAWRDGEEIHVVNDPSQWNNRVLGATFLDGKFGEVVFGWHSFSNLDHELWFDDVVVATSRIGCG